MSLARRGAIVSVVDIVASNVQTTLARIDSAGLGGQVDRHAELTGSASIPFASGSFDRVHTTGVLHHIVEPLPVLLEFHRLLKPRGKLTVMVYTEFLEARLETLIVGMMGATPGLTRSEAFGSFTDGHGAPHTRSYTVEQGEILLEEAGFKLLSTSEYNDRDFRTFRAVKA
jgi:ubiquinone/menaquinone biosynthesis C-methylase UbiE